MLQGQEVSHIYESITTCYPEKMFLILYNFLYTRIELSGVFKPIRVRKLNGKQVRLVLEYLCQTKPVLPPQR
jgi:hypothetical protein